MVHESPVRKQHEEYTRLHSSRGTGATASERPGAAAGVRIAPLELEHLPWGPPGSDGQRCEIVATCGEVQAEYAAIRRGAGIFDSPHRGTLRVSGTDRRDFLNRLVTAELKDLEPGIAREAFWLNRKGRIQADLLLLECGSHLLISVDIHQVEATLKSLTDFIFTEDVEIKDLSADMHHIAVHGKRAIDVIENVSDDEDFTVGNHCCASVLIASSDVTVGRRDLTGEIGLELMIPRDRAPSVWEKLLATDDVISAGKRHVRPIGWYAFNTARIEAGVPMFNIDFGTTNLPHETGLLNQRVSFTKGCFVGQEVVARMEHLGAPKQALMGLRMQGDLLPVAGAQVFERSNDQAEMGDQIGIVTSSTLSPMLGAAPVAFAMLRTRNVSPGTTVLVNAEGEQVEATVGELCFLPSNQKETAAP